MEPTLEVRSSLRACTNAQSRTLYLLSYQSWNEMLQEKTNGMGITLDKFQSNLRDSTSCLRPSRTCWNQPACQSQRSSNPTASFWGYQQRLWIDWESLWAWSLWRKISLHHCIRSGDIQILHSSASASSPPTVRIIQRPGSQDSKRCLGIHGSTSY